MFTAYTIIANLMLFGGIVSLVLQVTKTYAIKNTVTLMIMGTRLLLVTHVHFINGTYWLAFPTGIVGLLDWFTIIINHYTQKINFK
jgi:hypothetical protein